MDYKHIVLKIGSVACLTLNRPNCRNAMDDNTLKEVADAFEHIGRCPEVRAVVIRGEGEDFCAGADIGWMRRAGKLKGARGREDAGLLARMCKAVDESPVPVIARVQGAVYGGGVGLVSACDIVVAAQKARMCFSECRLGILPAVVSCFVIPKIGLAAARRYYLTAEVFGVQEARDMGLVHVAAPEGELDARVDELASHILRNGPKALREAKALLRKLPNKSLEQRVKLTIDTLLRVRSSPEGQEGLSAFLEKRPPSWVIPK